jgi:hypothetical protein
MSVRAGLPAVVAGQPGAALTRWWPVARRYVKMLTWYLGMLMRTAERVIAFRLKPECPRAETIAENRPVIVLSRHAGPGASLVLIHVLLRERR